MVFHVKSEFLSLFVHRFKPAESRENLIVANLELWKQHLVAIFCKIPPNPLETEATRVGTWGRNGGINIQAQDQYTEVAGKLAGDTLRAEHKYQNRGQGVTKDQYVDAAMAVVEKENVFVKRYAKWFGIAANVHLEDGSKQVCCQKTNVYAKRSSSEIFDCYHWCVSLELRSQPRWGSCWDLKEYPRRVALQITYW